LKLLSDIRALIDCNILLAWSQELQATSVIEVYPAANLTQYGIHASSHKPKSHQPERKDIISHLHNKLIQPEDTY
jgi:hypothetical protein